MTSEEIYEQVKTLRVHGSNPKYYHKVTGGNFRLDALQAGIVMAKLKYLEGWTEQRRKNAQTYDRLFRERGITDLLTLPSEVFPRHVYHQYVVRVKEKRDEFRGFLEENNVATEIYYPLPLHLQECFTSLGYKKWDFPESEKAADETIALPVSPELTGIQLEYVVETIARYF